MGSAIFDRVIVQTETGARTMSVSEFERLPLPERMGYILKRQVSFQVGETSVDHRTALDAMLREAVHKAAYQAELSIAQRIQLSILPKDFSVEGLQISAAMYPATEVGGDYYDVLPVAGGAWIGVGDVAGHGVTAGIIMLMLQSAAAAAVRARPDASPSELVCLLNEILFEGVRKRMGADEHATFTLMRYERSGLVTFAGAHEPILVLRAGSREVERIDTPGMWLGVRRAIEDVTRDSTIDLGTGDLVVLHTDGISEASPFPGAEAFGIEGICEAMLDARDGTVNEVRTHIMNRVREFTPQQRKDDMTLVALRFLGS